MAYDVYDTIAAVASPGGGAARGVVRVSGPAAIEALSQCFTPDAAAVVLGDVHSARRLPGVLRVAADGKHRALELPGQLLVWPTARSYAREPAAEFHTIGSQPLLAAVLEQLSRLGVRFAEPGEFTLRAFLAGRIDLTQAEAVLGVIDARERGDLDAALDQLAGGLSRPLHRLREQLLGVLAELEAGLDFVEEEIEFISRSALCSKLREGQEIVAEALSQLSTRDVAAELPRVAITGAPNAGKSSLFNALVRQYGTGGAVDAIVSSRPGATRDYVVGELNLNGVRCQLIDTAGITDKAGHEIEHAAQEATTHQRRQADLELCCIDGSAACESEVPSALSEPSPTKLVVLTKADLAPVKREDEAPAKPGSVYQGSARREPRPPGHAVQVSCSSATGAGLGELAERIRDRMADAATGGQHGVQATAARCAGSLRNAEAALAAAVELADCDGEELIAAEIRTALDALGEVVGAISTDDVLDRVFSQFCIGK